MYKINNDDELIYYHIVIRFNYVAIYVKNFNVHYIEKLFLKFILIYNLFKKFYNTL